MGDGVVGMKRKRGQDGSGHDSAHAKKTRVFPGDKGAFKKSGTGAFKKNGTGPFKKNGTGAFKKNGRPTSAAAGEDGGEAAGEAGAPRVGERIAQRARRAERKRLERGDYDIVTQGKRLWESVRRKDCSKQKRLELMSELEQLLRGHVKTIAFSHDSTRVLQCFIQFGSPEQRQLVFTELQPHILELTKSKYGKNIVKKLLLYGGKPLVGAVLVALRGSVRRLARHADGAAVLEVAYSERALLAQRRDILAELYGRSFTLTRTSESQTFGEVLELNPERKKQILEEMQQLLNPMVLK
ncbi:unnamed protein product [Lampetra fluviatilis]